MRKMSTKSDKLKYKRRFPRTTATDQFAADLSREFPSETEANEEEVEGGNAVLLDDLEAEDLPALNDKERKS